ncbi:hypothetical protein FNAPI_10969 [Fusarium napiforme]|uniref:Uncharacterized protein n=1 Tax=Fusarium napiforme TaxID=42672 RepID=A0A8H5MSE2_9HYPO|nr:hypothetical protein FNAPI_10969 [Fusarium napiforme]
MVARLELRQDQEKTIRGDGVPRLLDDRDSRAATEDTYRSLASRFTDMRYQVGRACAAAGYRALYQELDLLPEVSIAEEARESETDGGKLIYDEIMSFKYRYAIMDDCKRTIELMDYMAAHDGNIERYAQLANSGRTLTQLGQDCVIRGILHHTMYARWWADQIKNDTIYARSSPYVWDIQRAHVESCSTTLPHLKKAGRKESRCPTSSVPEMKRQCAAAAIVCDYQNVYKSLDPEPSWHLWKVASKFAANPFYREDQERRGREKDVDVEDDAFMESYYSELMQTRECTVFEEGGEKIADSVEKHEVH